MAELQYIVNVKCINTKLAEIITGEMGDLIIVNIPDSLFTPHEFDKLIDATKIIKDQASENRKNKDKKIEQIKDTNVKKYKINIIEKRELWDIRVLQSGELILINIPYGAFAPSEFDNFIDALKVTKNLAIKLRSQ